MGKVRIINADVMDGLAQLEDESAHCVVTSPPYWGLRDYGHHKQIGLEATPDAYVAKLVDVFRELRRVLRKDGTCWLNLGDSYAGSWSGNSMRPDGGNQRPGGPGFQPLDSRVPARNGIVPIGLKPKDLCGIPWRVAFALQSDGWWLRQDIIWSKPNPMPESVTDRCTKAHEYIFLLAKSQRYYFDAEAIAEPFADVRQGNPGAYRRTTQAAKGANNSRADTGFLNGGGGWNVDGTRIMRNKRDVWEITACPFPEAHFATFPPDLVEPCIRGGCPEGGTVLDPFGGSGTTGLVADRLRRNAILIELNPEYAEMAERRIKGDAPMFADVMVLNG